MRLAPMVIGAALILAACGGATSGEALTATVPAAESAASGSTPDASAPAATERVPTTAGEPTAAAEPTEAVSGEELRLTPAQGEGPFYPVDVPADHDNDLTVVGDGAGAPQGEVLLLDGRLLLEDGTPVAGAIVEIWQVDANGIYLHPNDDMANRDPNFQGYGEILTDAEGNWSFRTIYPARYEPRPRHVHVKVRLDGAELLTTQIYFVGDETLESDRLFAEAENGELLLAEIERTEADDGSVVLVAHHLLVVPS